MRKLYWIAMVCAGVGLSGCSTIDQAQPVNTQSNTIQSTLKPPAPGCPKVSASAKKVDPLTVALYTGGKKPVAPFKVVGKTTISKFNTAGIKRQEAIIRDLMRQTASRVGGNAIINIKHDEEKIYGTIVAYKQRILA